MKLKSKAPEVGRHRARELNGATRAIRGLRSSGLLLRNHVNNPAVRQTAPEQPTPPANPASKSESLNHSYTHLKSGEMAPITNRPPLQTAEKIFLETGVNFGPLLAIVRPPNSEPFYCFDNSTHDQYGEKTGRYTILSKQQMLQRMDGKQLSDGPIRLELGQHAVGGQDFANPKRMSREEIAYDYNGISKDPRIRGNVDFWANSNSPDLYVSDLGSDEGTVIQHNPELLPQADPWKGQPLHGIPVQS